MERERRVSTYTHSSGGEMSQCRVQQIILLAAYQINWRVMCVDSSGAACCGSCESMTVVRAIVAVLKMVMLKAMERGILQSPLCRAVQKNMMKAKCAHARSCELRSVRGDLA